MGTERRGKVLTNPSFQRQLLLFARLGFRWFSTLGSVWQSQKEQSMTRFRDFTEKVAGCAVADFGNAVPPEMHWRMVIFIRDGTMRGEMKLNEPTKFDLDSDAARGKAGRRIRRYAEVALKRKWT